MYLRRISRLAKFILQLLGYGLLCSVLGGITVYILILERGPDLSVWHQADLDEEFTDESDITRFGDYLAL